MVTFCFSNTISLKRFIIFLEQQVPRYSRPKRELEQYRTPPEIGIELVMSILKLFKPGDVILDAGSGTGMLTYMVACLAPIYVVGVEIDVDAIYDAISSSLYTLLPNIDFVQADISYTPLRKIDYAVSNPPFGISGRRGSDVRFLRAIAVYRPKAIASLHSGFDNSPIYIIRQMRALGYDCNVISKRRFPIPAMYNVHRKKTHYTEVVELLCIGEGRGSS
ncbi:MAG TPA: methyltransferase domain-containing protein [Pyrodictiaceae archaeon]|nr:methyltransferase domain-containing protein [Pyrodictiaceae archaeon]HIQ56292.1 methyltransferase domain-containing protein [Pyrodictium sp.]